MGNRVCGAVRDWDRAAPAGVPRPARAGHRLGRGASGDSRPAIFTLGYQQRTIRQFVELLLEASVDVLIDVRETAWSHKPGFSKRALDAALAAVGIEYLHARFAGNPKRLRASASSHADCLARYAAYLGENRSIMRELDQVISKYLEAGRRVCLTCYERHPGDCHRGILAARWSAKGRRRVNHLATDGCPRLVSQPV